MTHATADLREAARSLRMSPVYTVSAVLTLAVTIAATTSVFSAVSGVLLRPLAYASPDRLVGLWSTHPQQGARVPPSYADYRDWRERAGVFDGTAFVRGEGLLLRGPEGVERLGAAYVSAGTLAVLGTPPLLGRAFLPEEERPGGAPVAVLSYGLWQSRFGGDPGAVGRVLRTDHASYTVVGVMPRGFGWPAWAQLWMPLDPELARWPALAQRDHRVDNRVVARVREGIPLARAAADLAGVARTLEAEHPSENAGWTAVPVPLRDEIVGNAGGSLRLLLAAVAFVLLIACADLANLALVRAAARRRETAVRAALGAGRWGLARRALAESLLIAGAATALAVPLSAWGVEGLVRTAPTGLPRLDEVGLDLRVLAFTAGLAAATALLVGLAPALHAAGTDPAPALQQGARAGALGRGGARLRSLLVVVQVALAVMLLSGAGLLMRSFWNARAVDPGFEPAGVLTLRIEPPPARYDTPEELTQLYDAIRRDVARLPGVLEVGYVNHLPFSGTWVGTPVLAEGSGATPSEAPSALYRLADDRYFHAVGQAVVRGRGFAATESRRGGDVLIVNRSLAELLWSGGDPLGRRLTVLKQAAGRADSGQPFTGTVIGVVEDAKVSDLSQPATPEVYLPWATNVWPNAFLTVRTRPGAAGVADAVRRVVRAADADLPVGGLTALGDLLASSLEGRRFTAALVTGFSAAALVLALLGLYGVVAYIAGQRRREIGIRCALGARGADVVALVLGHGFRLAAAGALVGTALALGARRLLRGMLFEVGTFDAPTFGVVVALMIAVALLAAGLPALRASRVGPAAVLRDDA